MNSYRQIPKIELHLHLDCSLSYNVVSRLRPSVTLEEYNQYFIAPEKCPNLKDFLTRADYGVALMQTEQELKAVTLDLMHQLMRDNVIYAEIRFAPLLHLKKGLRAEQVVETVLDAMVEGISKTNVVARLILCTLRHFSEAQSMQTAKLVDRYLASGVVAMDLAADEAGFPIDHHIAAFDYLIERAIPRIAHAGEAKGPQSIWETLSYFKPSRLGHGVRAIEDPDLIEELRHKQIHLEVCPSCNVQINLYESFADHPVDALYRAGLPISINTDCRTLTNIDLSGEYEKLIKTFGWRLEQIKRCNEYALASAFISSEQRSRLLDLLQIGYEAFVPNNDKSRP